ncbi:hypothetical protein AAG570_000775 [Ranatra chinensis]|uniref:Prefoldin subunit 5 n=1 Tax=Ranatra chinensis TaxID=642074 RepID=A0ABD0Z8E8_9HEMI
MQQIELNKLSLPQLTQLKKQLEQELGLFQESLTTLKVAQTKYGDSKESLEKMQPNSKGSKILVPLTSSMFVPGTIADSEKVIIEIGTGYYVQMDMESAKDYFKRRVAYVTEQMEKIQNFGIEKSKLREGKPFVCFFYCCGAVFCIFD